MAVRVKTAGVMTITPLSLDAPILTQELSNKPPPPQPLTKLKSIVYNNLNIDKLDVLMI